MFTILKIAECILFAVVCSDMFFTSYRGVGLIPDIGFWGVVKVSAAIAVLILSLIKIVKYAIILYNGILQLI